MSTTMTTTGSAVAPVRAMSAMPSVRGGWRESFGGATEHVAGSLAALRVIGSTADQGTGVFGLASGSIAPVFGVVDHRDRRHDCYCSTATTNPSTSDSEPSGGSRASSTG